MCVVAGCRPSSEVKADVEKGEEVFAQRCVLCHGSTGHGDGPASGSLDPKPRKFADHAWQAKVSDDDIERAIRLGGTAVGKSAVMPANPDIDDPAIIAGLRSVVRRFDKD
ncbi:MAG TPA: cytochrome c [Kofleriaceae bacterium]|nr:cytochrome c [Kofleriaceae bacterium]